MKVRIVTQDIMIVCECGARLNTRDLPEAIGWICEEAARHGAGARMSYWIEIEVTASVDGGSITPGTIVM